MSGRDRRSYLRISINTSWRYEVTNTQGHQTFSGKIVHRSKLLRRSVELQITTSLLWQRTTVVFNYHNRPPTVCPRPKRGNLIPSSDGIYIHSVRQGHRLTTLILFGVYTKPIKGVYCLASCYGCILNPTLNLGEGQTSASTADSWRAVWFGWNKVRDQSPGSNTK